jgi:hypothetical protein
MLRFASAITWSLLLAGALQAQQDQQMPVDVKGKLVGMSGTVILIQDNAGKVYQADTSQHLRVGDVIYKFKPCSINVTGKESIENLRPGMYVQFEVKLQGKKTAVEEVKGLTIVTPNAETRVGVIQSEPAEPAGAATEDKKRRPSLEVSLILGQITKARNGALTVTYPNEKGPPATLAIRVASDAVIDVSGNDLNLARVGDNVEASGTSFKLPHFIAHKIKVDHSPASSDKPARGSKNKTDEKTAPVKEPDVKKPMAEAPAKPKIKLELIKVN